MRKGLTAVAIAASMIGGAGAGIVLSQTGAAQAASPATQSASATPSTSAAPAAGVQGDARPADPRPGGPCFGGRYETVSDASVAAKAIGITEADLITALKAGTSLADVAKAHSVDVQKVIDALVADAQAELAAQVKAGTITQAQADQMKAGITQRVTDQVNATHGPGFGRHGFGGPDHGDGGPAAPLGTPGSDG